jgi:hypothetical protein
MTWKTSIISLALLCVGCSQQSQRTPQASAPASEATVAPATPVIVRVVSRDLTITAHAGPNGPIYAVQSKDGQTLVPSQNLQDLHVNEPTLARHIRTMQADGWAGLD